MALLEVQNLSIGYRRGSDIFTAVDSVSFSLEKGKSLGFVGESGCGKTTVGMALLRLLPENGRVLGGEIHFDGQNILKLSDDAMRHIRWKKIAMIFQAAMNALNPVQRVEAQVAEAMMIHDPGMTAQEAREQVAVLFDTVGIPAGRLRDYPHQYSGGMKQRAIIAMALACEPSLIIADEPTTALDVIVQDQILEAIRALQKKMNIGIIFISHDISVVADVCHNIAVMYDGEIVEYGQREEVFEKPAHPYTRLLLASHMTLTDERKKMPPVPDETTSNGDPLHSCPFRPRCPERQAVCSREPRQWMELSPTHRVLCWQNVKESNDNG